MKTYIIKYEIHEEIEADNELDALIYHQEYLAEKLGSMIKEIVWEKEEEVKPYTNIDNIVGDMIAVGSKNDKWG